MSEDSQDLPVAKVILFRVEPGAPPDGGDQGNQYASAETSTGTIVMIPSDQADGPGNNGNSPSESESVMNEVEIGTKDLYLSGSVTVGRKEICDLRPVDNDRALDSTVSRIHCIVTASRREAGKNSIEFTDMSSNSTYINDVERVKKGETRRFSDKFFLSIGRNIFDSDLNDPPRRFRIRCELTPYGEEQGLLKSTDE